MYGLIPFERRNLGEEQMQEEGDGRGKLHNRKSQTDRHHLCRGFLAEHHTTKDSSIAETISPMWPWKQWPDFTGQHKDLRVQQLLPFILSYYNVSPLSATGLLHMTPAHFLPFAFVWSFLSVSLSLSSPPLHSSLSSLLFPPHSFLLSSPLCPSPSHAFHPHHLDDEKKRGISIFCSFAILQIRNPGPRKTESLSQGHFAC